MNFAAKLNYKFSPKTAKLIVLSILPLLAIGSFFIFENGAKNEDIQDKMDPKVAGAQVINTADYLGKDLPILPNAEITSLYSSNNQLNMIIESNQTEAQIQNFYEDYFFENGWQKVSKYTFQKESQKMDLEISGNLIKLRIYSAVPTK